MKVIWSALLLTLLLVYPGFRHYSAFQKKAQAMAETMAHDGGDNIWDRPRYLAIQKELQNKKYDVVFFCDSVMFTNGNADQRTIAASLEGKTGLRVMAIAGPGFSPVVFKEYIKILDNVPYKPLVIIAVNLRSFSEKWFTDYQYRELSEFIGFYNWKPSLLDWAKYHIIWHESDIFSYYKSEIYERHDHNSNKYFNSNRTELNTSSKLWQAYNESYGLKINNKHPMLSNLLSMIKNGNHYASRILLYLTPINTDGISSNCNEYTVSAINKNIETLKHALEDLKDNTIQVIDMTHTVPARHFPEPQYANEHLDQYGRDRIADVLSDAVRNTLP